MGKTAKLKRKQTAPHSRAARRAARRAASPSIDLDKSLKNLPPPAEDSPSSTKTPKPHVLQSQSPGITKRGTKSKPLKRAQRLRQMQAMERAADAMDRMEVRVQKSVGKEKKVKERSKAWEEVNGQKRKLKSLNAFEALESSNGGEWVSDEEMPEVEGGGEPVVSETGPPPVAATATDTEDEQL